MLVRSIIPIIALMACMALFGASQQKEIRHVPVVIVYRVERSQAATARPAIDWA